MIKKKRQQEPTIWRLSSTGVRPPLQTFRWAQLHAITIYLHCSIYLYMYFTYFYLKCFDLTLWSILKVINYEKELSEMKNMTRQEFVASLRRYLIIITFLWFFYSMYIYMFFVYIYLFFRILLYLVLVFWKIWWFIYIGFSML